MFAAVFLHVAMRATSGYNPQLLGEVETATGHFAVQRHRTAQLADFLGTRFPHHSGSQARISKGIDQRFDYLLSIFWLPAGKRVLDSGPQRKPFDALRRPVGGDLIATHPPDLLCVGLEEDAEQAPAKLIRDPILKSPGITRRM